MSLQENVACTCAAREFIELGEDIACSYDGRRFWLAVAAMANDRAGLVEEHRDLPLVPDPLAAMTDAEAKAFGREIMSFGKHKGDKLRDIPLEYLAWLADQARFHIDVMRYFRSGDVRREGNETDDRV